MSIWNNNSTANYREYADHASFDVANLTIAAWVRPRTVASSTARIAVRGVFSLNGEFSFGTTTGGTAFRMSVKLSDSVQYDAIDPATYSANTRYHLVGRVDTGGDTIKLYKDGTEVASTALAAGATFVAQATAIRLFQTTGGAALFDTEIAELAIWDAVLDTNEISALSKGINPRLIRPSALVLYDPCYINAGRDRIHQLGADTGTLVSVDHPRIFNRPATERAPQSGDRNISAAIAGDGAVAALLEGLGELSTAIAGTSTVTADGQAVFDSSATIAGIATVTAVIEGYGELKALIEGVAIFGKTSNTSFDGGYGREPFGDPFGAGGPLHVLRARALKSQVVRVVFNEEPLHQSAAGRLDALNPANYLFSAVSGEIFDAAVGTVGTLLATGVDEKMIKGLGIAFFAPTERGFDVHVDKPLIIGMTYKVTLVNVISRQGGILTAPNEAVFVGILRNFKIRPLRQPRDLIDLKNPIQLGNYIIDDSGDLAVEGGLESLRKRVFRRLTTTLGAFTFIPSYGIGLKLKELASVGELQILKANIVQQVRREPEVLSAEARLSLNPLGILTVQLDIRIRSGAPLALTMTRLADGTVLT